MPIISQSDLSPCSIAADLVFAEGIVTFVPVDPASGRHVGDGVSWSCIGSAVGGYLGVLLQAIYALSGPASSQSPR